MELPQSYVIQAFYTYCKRPTYKKYQGDYNAECCVCNEGSSAGRKRRLFYYPRDRFFYCFNCTRSWNEIEWLKEVTQKSFSEICRESESYDTTSEMLREEDRTPKKIVPAIPEDSVNLFDEKQVSYYIESFHRDIVLRAMNYIKDRRLDTAVNRPKSLYLSFDDFVHKDRLIIPFYSNTGKIGSYQSRLLLDTNDAKYLTKYGEKCLYGENTISEDIPYIFVFEGPIDAMFCKNGVAVGGAKRTDRQNQFLETCIGHEVIYVFDNDKNNEEMESQVIKTIKRGGRVLIWPKKMSKFKDVNEICCHLSTDEIPYSFFVKNSFKGLDAEVKFKSR